MATPEQKLKRFLHYGREIPVYQPGDRGHSDVYHPTELTSVNDLIANEKPIDAINCIVKAFTDGYSAHPDMLIYALAICARQNTSEPLREAAYKAVKTVCVSPDNLFMFIKFARKLSACNSIWGSGCRKVIKDWYLKKDVKTLAAIVGRNKRLHGWSHKDVIKLIHLKSDEPARGALLKYILYGLETAKTEFGEKSEATEVLSQLQVVEDLRHCTDEQQAARTIEIHDFTLDHVPTHLLKSKEVWLALVPRLPLDLLLSSLERLGHLGFLKPGSPIAGRVLEVLADEAAVAEARLQPARVFIAMRNYETSSKFLAVENALKKQKVENGSGEAKKVVKIPPKPNQKIVQALLEVLQSSLRLLAPTSLRYLLCLDLRSGVVPGTAACTERCRSCPHVSPLQAVALLTLCLQHADTGVTVCVQKGDKMDSVDTAGCTTMEDAMDKIKDVQMQRLSMTTPLKWALANKLPFDVFILASDSNVRGTPADLLSQYRAEMSLPSAKLVTLSLRCSGEPNWASSVDDPGMLDVTGFDAHVPRVIEAFSRGAF